MAPPPEYDKEPKAPDKSVTNISTDDSKVLYNSINDQQNNSEKSTNAAAASAIENNKHVGGLDDGQLRALLDEAIAYKRPKDREGKSSLFKELLEEVELDEKECEVAARSVTGRRGARGTGHGQRMLPHSNSLQDLMAAALGVEPPRQRAHAHPPPASVSARAHHGGSLPSGVNTSSMMNEEPARGGYLATVRCVNPPPLAERRVSASDANAPSELEHLNRKSKPMFPVTYTARATLEIGSSSVCSGRAVTTTTPSNQITHVTRTCGPPERLYKSRMIPRAKSIKMKNRKSKAIGKKGDNQKKYSDIKMLTPSTYDVSTSMIGDDDLLEKTATKTQNSLTSKRNSVDWTNNINTWYKGLNKYFDGKNIFLNQNTKSTKKTHQNISSPSTVNYTEEDHKGRLKYKENEQNPSVPVTSVMSFENFTCTTIGTNEEPLNQKKKDHHKNLKTDYQKPNTSKEKLNIETRAGKITEDSSKLSTVDVSEICPDSSTSSEVDELSVLEMKDMSKPCSFSECEVEDSPKGVDDAKSASFLQFVKEQQKLFQVLKSSDDKETNHNVDVMDTEQFTENLSGFDNSEPKVNCEASSEKNALVDETNFKTEQDSDKNPDKKSAVVSSIVLEENCYLDPLSNNTYIILSSPRIDASLTNITTDTSTRLNNEKKDLTDKPELSESEKGSANIFNTEQVKKSCLTVFFLENRHQIPSEFLSSLKLTSKDKEIDATIPFSCITTPEVVASSSTTSTTPMSSVAVDPKPLQLGSCYRAVASLTGEAPAPPRAPQLSALPAHGMSAATAHEQPRSVVSSSLNGLPISRSGYGAGVAAAATAATAATAGTAATASAADECKKSFDENGNTVQGFSSPLSGSSHNKKPRRKKSSKNETVIKSQEIDGYQGNKDLNEVLRFIESNAETTRGNKVRAKHKDDDEKGKKRSTERRKDKENKMKRATSLEELSRTKLEDLTDKQTPRTEPAKPAKPERRSWGEDAREPREFNPEVIELTDFQTVTKKRKPRRRNDEPEPPRRARLPAPPSDRSNDSNDDMDSVHSLHSLPADAASSRPAPPPHASYADIARSRQNIPDLIESCNFYESEAVDESKSAEPPAANATAAQTGDDYPALETRKKRDKPRPPRKERSEAPPTSDCPAPDVVSDRRPAVILLDCSSKPRDMDGVTFGFDINEQLVGGARRPRCDLVRDALEGAVAVAVGARDAALHYLPPHTKHNAAHLHQIVDYVGAAWEEALRCGAGKACYFSE